MSYTPSSARARRDSRDASGAGAAGSRAGGPPDAASRPAPGATRVTTPAAARRPPAPPDAGEDDDVDWGRVGVFGAGIFVGALFGVGAALLLAPQSGAATRRTLRRRVSLLREDARDGWDDLGEQLRHAKRSLRRKRRDLRRRVERRRWALADAVAGERPDAEC